MKYIFTLMFMILFFIMCKKNSIYSYDSTIISDVFVEFDNVVGSSDLTLNTGSYTNSSNETIRVNALKYFVSNFYFINSDGNAYRVPQDDCYFLIDESDAESLETNFKIPEGEYIKLGFMVGVDSARNTLDVSRRTGVLNYNGVAADMYWTWKSGYIHYKIEGKGTPVGGLEDAYYFHIGGWGGGYNGAPLTPNNTRFVELDLTTNGTPKVKTGIKSHIHLFVDVLKLFDGPHVISVKNSTMDITAGAKVADNFVGMFSHNHTHNE